MPPTGTPEHPLRIAIVGAGPAGFYVADALLKHEDPFVEVDMFDELPTPFGLVRSGVAPDHEKIKNVTRVFDRTAGSERFRFFGNVSFGRHVDLDGLRALYHQVVFTTGAQTDRTLGIPGEDLPGSHSATEFVWWYNGHPGFRQHTFDLSCERVVVVGVGNVAVDVARILCRTPEELERTDIADYALEALRESRIKEVVMLGRRGPAQAAFTNPEVKELGEMEDADFFIREDEAALDALSREYVESQDNRLLNKKVELLQEVAARPAGGKSKRIVLRFLVSPIEILDDGNGRVGGVRLVRNVLFRSDDGRIRPRPTDETEDIPCGLVFRSVGYRGVPLPGVPFRNDWAIVPNDQGRVLEAPGGEVVPGLYVAGWIKRGPTGVIGTNKGDAQETVARMLEDLAAGTHLDPSQPAREAAERYIRECQPRCFTYEDWKRIEAIENEAGEKLGRPRVKLTRLQEMLEVLG